MGIATPTTPGFRTRGHAAAVGAAGAMLAAGMPHAVLVVGPPGVGKSTFADDLAAALLCTAEREVRPCRSCRACRALEHGNHPDVHRLAPTGAGNADPQHFGRRHATAHDQGRKSVQRCQSNSYRGQLVRRAATTLAKQELSEHRAHLDRTGDTRWPTRGAGSPMRTSPRAAATRSIAISQMSRAPLPPGRDDANNSVRPSAENSAFASSAGVFISGPR